MKTRRTAKKPAVMGVFATQLMVAAKPLRVEAYGARGMKSTPWRKVFKSAEALNAWCEKTGATVYGMREIPASEVF